MKISNLKNISFVLLFILLSFGNLQAQTRIFSEAKGKPFVDRSYDFEKWNFTIDGQKYEIKNNGQGKRIVGKNRVKKFLLPLDKKEILDRVIYFAGYKNDLLLICETSVFDAGAGFIIRLDGKSLKVKWKKHILGFNIARALIEGKTAYLAAVGFAAKINLETGSFIWKHEDFYRKYKEEGAFNIFEVPKIRGNIITYTENQDEYNPLPNIIKFNKYSGKVIEVKVN
jgi:hypothetical protein